MNINSWKFCCQEYRAEAFSDFPFLLALVCVAGVKRGRGEGEGEWTRATRAREKGKERLQGNHCSLQTHPPFLSPSRAPRAPILLPLLTPATQAMLASAKVSLPSCHRRPISSFSFITWWNTQPKRDEKIIYGTKFPGGLANSPNHHSVVVIFTQIKLIVLENRRGVVLATEQSL